MSTRRARIKAVAALPPRRKNADTVDGSKNKQIPSKEVAETGLKSPGTSRSLTTTPKAKNSPSVKTLRPTPPLLPISRTKTPISTVPSINTPLVAARTTPEVSEKSISVPVITSASSSKSISNIFASPPARNSPDVKIVSPPLVPPSPTLEQTIQRSALESLDFRILVEIENNQLKARKNNAEVNKTTYVETKNDIPDDYSVPSVPESITDETVDGIVPLQPARTAPHPIDLLKNEIISEYAEALFDPIVPLPSPSKVRPKLRPVPRLAPHRRNSVQGSASESEDDSRRALLNSGAPQPAPPRQRHDSHTSHNTLHSVPNREVTRIRNDSVCSAVSQATVQPPPTASPVKEKHLSKARRQEMSRRMWRRRRDTVKRDALTMYDLIFYNPTTKPIIPDQDELKAKEANAKAEAERQAKTQESEEEEEDPPAAAAPVPQIKLGPNGEIILDEKSLVIKQSGEHKVSSVVREGAWGSANGGRYTRAARTAEWSQAETVRFYRALAAIGTDFTLMAPLFPDRNRKDLKLKFKKEEKLNGAQVDKALRSATTFDVVRLQDEFKEERAEAARRAEAERLRLLESKEAERERMRAARELRVRPSKGSKALESTMDPRNMDMTADSFIQRAMENKRNRKKQPKHNLPHSNVANVSHPSEFATLTRTKKPPTPQRSRTTPEMATISRVDHKQIIPGVPSNIESGSLVVLRVNDPKSPSKTMLQTYIAHGAGKLTPVALPSTFLNSVVGYMKKGTPKSGISAGSSPQLTSPSSVASQDSRSCTPGVIQLNPSPAKRQRHSSYTITSL